MENSFLLIKFWSLQPRLQSMQAEFQAAYEVAMVSLPVDDGRAATTDKALLLMGLTEGVSQQTQTQVHKSQPLLKPWLW